MHLGVEGVPYSCCGWELLGHTGPGLQARCMSGKGGTLEPAANLVAKMRSIYLCNTNLAIEGFHLKGRRRRGRCDGEILATWSAPALNPFLYSILCEFVSLSKFWVPNAITRNLIAR
jgi:hypothetical protein